VSTITPEREPNGAKKGRKESRKNVSGVKTLEREKKEVRISGVIQQGEEREGLNFPAQSDADWAKTPKGTSLGEPRERRGRGRRKGEDSSLRIEKEPKPKPKPSEGRGLVWGGPQHCGIGKARVRRALGGKSGGTLDEKETGNARCTKTVTT